MSHRLMRVVDCYGKVPEADQATYVLFEDEQPVRWLTDREVTGLAVEYHEGKPAKHWQVATIDGTTIDHPGASDCQLGQAYGVGPWAYRITGPGGEFVAEYPADRVHYVRQVSSTPVGV